MKFKSIILSAFAVFSLASCSKDTGTSSTDSTNTSKQGYLTLSLSSPSRNTLRTSGTSTDSGVADNENVIKTVTVLLVGAKGGDAAGKILQIFPDAPYTAGNTPSTANSFRVNIGTYEVFAVVNPSGNLSAHLVVGNQIETVLSVAGNEELEGYANNTNAFCMINERNAVDVTAGIPIQVTTSNTLANPAKAAIKVDRLVSALQLAEKTPTVTFTLQSSDASPSSVIKTAKVGGFFPIYARRNFNTIQKWETKGTDVILSNASPAIAPDSTAMGSFYNRVQDVLTYDNKVATKAQSIPDFRSLYYVLENRPDIVEADSILTSYNVGTTGVVFQVTAQDSEGNSKTFYRVTQSNKYFYDRESAIKERNTLYSDQIETTTTKAEDLRKAGIRVYEDGVMYYTYYIKDNNYTYKSKKSDLHYYAVHRNAVYRLQINTLNTVGNDLPMGDIADPAKPELIIHTYLSVSVSVNPWVLDLHEIDL